jgi:dienelactone hydrolase
LSKIIRAEGLSAVRWSRWRGKGALAGAFVMLCAGCSSASAGPLHVRLDAGPAAGAFVTPVHVAASGLPADGLVTVQARADDYEGRPWESAAQYRASATGTLNLATAVPVSGSYHVADAAGLLWSLHPAFAAGPGTQFYMLYSGFSVSVRVLVDGRIEASATLQRLGAIPYSTQTVRADGFAATFFVPPSPRPGAPAVVVIGGSGGGEDTFVAGALAELGYPALALGYFKEPGLPQCLCDIPLEYFARAAAWLRAQPQARGRRIIPYGVSRGGEGALLIASLEPNLFSAVIASSPSAYVNGPFGGVADSAWTFHGMPLTVGTPIPVGNIRVPLLLGDGGMDAVWDSEASVTTVMSELRAANDPAPYINLFYPDAGHAFLGTPPYFPYDGLGGLGNSLGGSQQANAVAEEQSWARMIEFLNNPWRA